MLPFLWVTYSPRNTKTSTIKAYCLVYNVLSYIKVTQEISNINCVWFGQISLGNSYMRVYVSIMA